MWCLALRFAMRMMAASHLIVWSTLAYELNGSGIVEGFPVSVLEWFPVLSIFNCCCSIFGVRNCQCMPFLRHFAAFWPLQHFAARSCHSTEFAGLWFISGWRLYLYVFIGLVYIGSIHSVPLIVVIKLSSCLTHLDRKAAQRRQKHKT